MSVLSCVWPRVLCQPVCQALSEAVRLRSVFGVGEDGRGFLCMLYEQLHECSHRARVHACLQPPNSTPARCRLWLLLACVRGAIEGLRLSVYTHETSHIQSDAEQQAMAARRSADARERSSWPRLHLLLSASCESGSSSTTASPAADATPAAPVHAASARHAQRTHVGARLDDHSAGVTQPVAHV